VPCSLVSGALAASPLSRYMLFLDDDVECHPSTLGDLVDLLERDPTLFMASGGWDCTSTCAAQGAWSSTRAPCCPCQMRLHQLPRCSGCVVELLLEHAPTLPMAFGGWGCSKLCACSAASWCSKLPWHGTIRPRTRFQSSSVNRVMFHQALMVMNVTGMMIHVKGHDVS